MLDKSIFNGGEVDYLTVKNDSIFHVFLNKDVLDTLSSNLEVCNSKARRKGEFSEQKVLFRYKGKNAGEIEIRTDSPSHYREIKFSLTKPKTLEIFFERVPFIKKYNDFVFVYGNAARKFGRWKKSRERDD